METDLLNYCCIQPDHVMIYGKKPLIYKLGGLTNLNKVKVLSNPEFR